MEELLRENANLKETIQSRDQNKEYKSMETTLRETHDRAADGRDYKITREKRLNSCLRKLSGLIHAQGCP
jgi:hypothetical protein